MVDKARNIVSTTRCEGLEAKASSPDDESPVCPISQSHSSLDDTILCTISRKHQAYDPAHQLTRFEAKRIPGLIQDDTLSGAGAGQADCMPSMPCRGGSGLLANPPAVMKESKEGRRL